MTVKRTYYDGLEEGRNEGFQKAHDEGYKEGKEAGYEDGYAEGQFDAEEDFEWRLEHDGLWEDRFRRELRRRGIDPLEPFTARWDSAERRWFFEQEEG